MSKTVVKYKEVAMAQRDELAPSDVIAQVEKITQIKNAVMRVNEHYGIIPGTQKPTLFKAGAEKLAMTFRFAPKFAISVTNLNHGDHREYSIVCTLTHITSGNLLAEGVGSCSTMETKYRYRKADPEVVGSVPQAYWKEKDAGKKVDLIGGRGFGVKKIGAAWQIVKFSAERVEHENPADFYNTALKMAKKRAFVDAVITATGGSDLFTQDIEDDHEPMTNGKAITTDYEDAPMPEPDERLNEKIDDVLNNAAPPVVKEKLQGAPREPQEKFDARVALTEWRDAAKELKSGDLFDAEIKKLLTSERVKRIEELALGRQKTIVSAMAAFVEDMQKK